MRIKELHEILQQKKNGKVTQFDIARAIGTSRANVSKLFSKNSFINDMKLKKIEEYFDVIIEKPEDSLILDYYPESLIEFKNGKAVMSENHVKFKLPFALFKVNKDAKYVMTNMPDDSMAPYIQKGDFVVIELCKTSDLIINNKVHSFIYEDCFYIRRLSKNINQILVQSDNKTYPVQYVEKSDINKLQITGYVVYMIRTKM